VEVARWLRTGLGPAATFSRFTSLLHHAFDLPRERLRPLDDWTGWRAGGSLGDTELHNGAPRALDESFRTAYLPPFPAAPAPTMPLRPGTGFGVWTWTGDGHDLVLRAVGQQLDLVFTAVNALQVRHFFDDLTIREAPSRGDLRHFVLTDGRQRATSPAPTYAFTSAVSQR
jgi:hypothetical protein